MTHFKPTLAQIRAFASDIRRELARLSDDGEPALYDFYERMSVPSRMSSDWEGLRSQSQVHSSGNRWRHQQFWLGISVQLNGAETLVTVSIPEIDGGTLLGSLEESGTVVNVYRDVPRGNGGYLMEIPRFDWVPLEGDEPPSTTMSGDLVIRELSGWAEGYAEVRPAEHLMANLPTGVRALAVQTISINAAGTVSPWITADGELRWEASPISTNLLSPDAMIAAARVAYRDQIRGRLGSSMSQENAEFERKRKEHRIKTGKNFEAFVRDREMDTEEHMLKLPFVPHGLASSRRWGIEVESGGARGVSAPTNWTSTSDGSLRSAYAGYVEVQDFEPYDEEVTERVHWENCTNSTVHDPRVRVINDHGEWMYVPRADYISPEECTACGDVTHLVRREPQTIHHSERSGDCREYVSPILTSMHSNGLQELTEALSKNPQNDSAGVHVHVEASDLSKQQIATIVFGYDILEPILEASYRRNRRDYCERRDVSEVLSAARSARGDGLSGDDGGRYRTLNTQSLSKHGTLEFRAMGPVYEYEYLIRWAMLCRELVNSVANGAQTKDFAKIKTWDDLVRFLALFGKEYIRAAVYEMTGEVGEVAKLEKAGQPITTEAMDIDFANLINGIYNVDEAFSRMARIVSSVGTTINTANLAVVGATSEI